MPNDPRTAPEPSDARSAVSLGLIPAAMLILYLCAMFRTAWVSDDAFITLRALDNFHAGYGLLSNPPERVLGFTNPLWAGLMLVPLSLGVPVYWTALGSGLVVSTLCACCVMFRCARGLGPWAAAIAALWMALSSAYVDFSTSGLENPLAHLLLALFFTAFLAGKLAADRLGAWLLAGLIALNRHDHGLLVAPALVSLLFDAAKERARAASVTGKARPSIARIAAMAALGFLPLGAWLSFALVYYGFPFPNTAYAKLNTEVSHARLIGQGLVYLSDSLARDPLTLMVIGFALLALVRRRSQPSLALGLGVLAYLVYLVRIGGDFMSGRFLSAPFLVCVVFLAAHGLRNLTLAEGFALALVSGALGAAFTTSFVKHEKLDCEFEETGIANERECYVAYTGLAANLRRPKYQSEGRYERGSEIRSEKRRVSVEWNVGMTGYAAGPDVHVIDLLALTDPLLARIPHRPRRNDDDFRIGHFRREEPAGYAKSVQLGKNRLKDPCLHAYYDKLLLLIRGPLFTRERWQAIWDLNLGHYDYLMKKPCPLAPKQAPSKKPKAGG